MDFHVPNKIVSKEWAPDPTIQKAQDFIVNSAIVQGGIATVDGVKSAVTGAANFVTNTYTTVTDKAGSFENLLSWVSENWKLSLIGLFAFVLLLKD